MQYGFLVTMIDGVEADSTQNQYWEILGGADMAPLPLGVSSYVPADREKVLFRLVTWNGEVDDGHADTGMFNLCCKISIFNISYAILQGVNFHKWLSNLNQYAI